MKTLSMMVAVIAATIVGLAWHLGLTLDYLRYGPAVASGMGAKLLCSAEFVSGFDRETARADLVQYSPLLDHLSVQYDTDSKTVTASFYGAGTTSASFLPGLGCALNLYPPSPPSTMPTRHAMTAPALVASTADWPMGQRVTTIDPSVQQLTDQLVVTDNANGLNTRALLVVHNGQVVAESYAQGASVETPLLGWSMAKSFTAIMLGNLEYRGLIDLNARPGFARWADDARGDIHINHLLTMTDGLHFTERYEPGDDSTKMLFTEPSASDYALHRASMGVPGETFNYSSGTANLLARLYVDTLGEPQGALNDLFTQVMAPLGMQHSVFETDTSGVFVGSSYLYASARDWARMGQLMLNGGQLNGQRLLSDHWVTRATTPNTSTNDRAYGYQWWLNRGNEQLRFTELPESAFFANGNRQQVVMVFPDQEAVIVRLGWTDGSYPIGPNFRSILDVLSTQPSA